MIDYKTLTTAELINEAQLVVLQENYDDSDILKLNRINFFLCKYYLAENVSGNATEWLYNKAKEELDDNLPVTKATHIAKLNAENLHWTFRQVKAEASGISKMMETVSWFIIWIQIKLKNENKVKF